MITFSVIQKSQLEGVQRIDPEYYQPEYLRLAKKIRSLRNKSLKQIAIIRSGTTPTDRDDELTEGVVLLKTTDIRNNILSCDDHYYHITSKIAERMSKTKLNTNDVLVNIVGATLEVIGRVSFVPNNFPKSNITQAMALLRIKNSDYLSEFIFSFLMSKYGQFQISRLARPTGQFNLNLEELGQILIPQMFMHRQKNITEIIKRVFELQEESNESYQQAENLLLEELGLKDFQVEEELNFVVNLSDIKNANRVDAEYFQPKYEKLVSKIKDISNNLITIFSIRRGDFISPDYYVEKAKRGYIRIKELPLKGDINLDSIIYIDDNFLGQNLETIQEGDFVFAGIGATLGKTARVPQELGSSFYSNNTARFRVKKEWRDKVDTYYLQLVFQSFVCQLQFEQRQAQTAQAKISDEELKAVLIPILSKPTQEKIAELVRKSHEARKKSKELLEEAKRKVEEMIEKGGE